MQKGGENPRLTKKQPLARIRKKHLKLNVPRTRVGAPRSKNLQGHITVAICDLKPAEEICSTK